MLEISGFLRPGDGATGYLRSQRSPAINAYLQANLGPAGDGWLRGWGRNALTGTGGGGGGFPTQFAGLRYFLGVVRELCLVALGDAPPGDQVRIRKGADTLALYLVDPSDPNASEVRIRTSDGIRAVRLKT